MGRGLHRTTRPAAGAPPRSRDAVVYPFTPPPEAAYVGGYEDDPWPEPD